MSGPDERSDPDRSDHTVRRDDAVHPDEAVGPDEEELLDAFDRLRPQGTVRWDFDDAVRRVTGRPRSSPGALPWGGLPVDLWERGRSARIGQRFVGDVANVVADVLAADSRAVADAAVAAVNGDRFVATWDALQYLSARVQALEARVDPAGLEVAEWPGPPPDQAGWVEAAGTWFDRVDPEAPVLVGESGDGALVDALYGAGRTVQGRRSPRCRGVAGLRLPHDPGGRPGRRSCSTRSSATCCPPPATAAAGWSCSDAPTGPPWPGS